MGRFVFLDLALKNADATTYRDQVTLEHVQQASRQAERVLMVSSPNLS